MICDENGFNVHIKTKLQILSEGVSRQREDEEHKQLIMIEWKKRRKLKLMER